jgi:predicted ABC-type ATPase
MPNLYIIAGCNGAGKTTASFTVLPEMLNCHEFVNTDEIAKGLSPFQPENAVFGAGKIMLRRIIDLIRKKSDFAFETTLAAKSYVKTIEKAKAAGYFTTLVFFWLNQTDLAIERVKTRVLQGGHDVEVETIIRRYHAGLKNFFYLYKPICNYWLFVDNSSNPFRLIAEGEKENRIRIYDRQIWETLKSRYYENL